MCSSCNMKVVVYLQKPVYVNCEPPTIKLATNESVVDSSEDEVPGSPATPRRKKISVGMPIHPPEGEITNLKIPINRRVEEIKGTFSKQERTCLLLYITCMCTVML